MENYLVHHGVKGQKWGVRKRIASSGFARRNAYKGARKANFYMQKRDIRKLKNQRRSGKLTDEQYKQQKQALKAKNSVSRGKSLVENKQSYGKIAVKGIAKQVALGLGTRFATNAILEMGGLSTTSLASANAVRAIGIGARVHYGIDDIRKLSDVHAYKYSKGAR